MIELCQKLTVPQEEAANQVAEMYQLEPEDINGYMRQYWNG